MDFIIKKVVLKRFFEISLSTEEHAIAEDAIHKKYGPSIRKSFFLSILLIPATLFLDTNAVISVLIPITMVAGTAWFSVSLASMKKKFENFGLELTLNLFTAFVLSLLMLMLLTASSLTIHLWSDYTEEIANIAIVKSVSALLAIIVVWNLMWSIFCGSLKYDMNDSMLSGQNEAAERFFKRSLSILHKTAENLRSNRSVQVANYSIGVSFYEIFNYMYEAGKGSKSIESSRQLADALIKKPAMQEEEANNIAFTLIELFLEEYTSKSGAITEHKSYKAIGDELECLKSNEEKQEMTDVRLSVVFQEMANLIEEFGERLFR